MSSLLGYCFNIGITLNVKQFFKNYVLRKRFKKIWIQDNKYFVTRLPNNEVESINPDDLISFYIVNRANNLSDVNLVVRGGNYLGMYIEVDDDTRLNFYSILSRECVNRMIYRRTKQFYAYIIVWFILLIIPMFVSGPIAAFLLNFRFFLYFGITSTIISAFFEYLRFSKIKKGLK